MHSVLWVPRMATVITSLAAINNSKREAVLTVNIPFTGSETKVREFASL